ncbi:hypothetical protein MF672_010675 [Actinomadura sp. ATCC 31491]|uniref:Uncharacterized protein n=1 Tax=Actinomadura luzonensis TaxID=2805427 RepID=A0ABT0FPL3_9ACTN|nr:hypothetical protein [Actinomadura luzonensis]MCK2214250.1 hypothetical protein [Actinomadura luzonensis]
MTNPTDPPPPVAGATLATAAPDFDWTRQLRPDVRGLVTTWMEIGERAIRHVSIVPQTTGAGR